MKNTFLTALMIFTGLLITGSMARAQETLLVDVPHDFVVNGQSLPAGAYHIGRVPNQGLGILQIRSDDGKSAIFILPDTFQANVSEMPQLSFIRRGDEYVLRGIQTPTGMYTLFATERKAKNEGRAAATMSPGN